MSKAGQTGPLKRYQRLNELARDLASTLDLETLLNRIVEAAATLCGAEAASILLYDESKAQLYFEATTNLEARDMMGMTIPVEGSVAGWIVTNRQPIVIADAQRDPRHFSQVSQATQIVTNSLLGIPMIAKDKMIGVLEAINKLEGEFVQEDQDLLMALGAQAAVAIENARLFQQSDLISELAHDLRTPLTSINTAAKMLSDERLPDELRDKMVELILKETRRLSKMTTDFLDFSRLETGRVRYQRQEIDILTLLNESVQVMETRAHEQGVLVIVESPQELPTLIGDQDKLKQVTINLLSNAVKYNRPAGKVTLSAVPQDEGMLLRVQDTGPGIPQECLPYLFEKFYRVPGSEHKAQGTGLGLTICKRIIEDHGGRIEVHSQLDVGTSFEIWLPLQPHENNQRFA